MLKCLSTCCSLHCPQCILDSPLRFGAGGLPPLVPVGRADAAESDLICFEEGNHEGLLVLGPAACDQAC